MDKLSEQQKFKEIIDRVILREDFLTSAYRRSGYLHLNGVWLHMGTVAGMGIPLKEFYKGYYIGK